MTAQDPQESRPTRGPSPQKTSRTRRKIIAAALEEFVQNGYAGTRMECIALRSGLGKGTLYRYFRTKEELLLGLVGERVTDIVGGAWSVPRAPGEPVRDHCRRTLLPMLGSTESSGRADLARLVLREGQTFPQLLDVYHDDIFRPMRLHLQRMVEDGQRTGEVAATLDPVATSYLLIAPLWFAITHNGMLSRNETVSGAELFAAQLDLIFAGRALSPEAASPGS